MNTFSNLGKIYLRQSKPSYRLLKTARCYSVTGNVNADKALKTITGGRIETWMAKYENLVGLTEVSEAQTKVIEAERAFQSTQATRRIRQQELTDIQNKLRKFHSELLKLQRGDERYLGLVTEEYEALKEEKKITAELGSYEQLERDHFSALSSAVRESHERERARAERTKYWSVIGSIVGAAIGIIGTSINNYLRMRELKGLVKQSTAGDVEMKSIVEQLAETMKKQYNQIQGFVAELQLRSSYDVSEGHEVRMLPLQTPEIAANLGHQTQEILEFVKQQDDKLELELNEIKKLLAVRSSDETKTIVYVGPEIESLLDKTESNLEWKMKSNALLVTSLVYGACIISLSVLYNIFKGGSAV